jgi:hypothetical protein
VPSNFLLMIFNIFRKLGDAGNPVVLPWVMETLKHHI